MLASEAEAYLEERKVKQLFRDLGTRLLFERPADPNAFLLATLEDMRNDRVKPFFTEQDIRACFCAYDIHGTGTITKEQYANALKSLGIDNATLDEDTVDRELFITKAMEAIAKQDDDAAAPAPAAASS